ncbi:hypothetical protein AB0J07_25375, partial [Microbispora rosea]
MTRQGTALGALGSLLDRSLAQIAEASADARTYDRRTIYEVADVWDNNTFPLFHGSPDKIRHCVPRSVSRYVAVSATARSSSFDRSARARVVVTPGMSASACVSRRRADDSTDVLNLLADLRARGLGIL